MEFEQSANTLFKFMNKDIYLYEILENKVFIPRYNDEDISYLEYGDNKLISVPMVCFCDIRFHKIEEHLKFYAGEDGYGIGLSKEWGIKKGIQPLQYINKQSPLSLFLKDIFKQALDDSKENIAESKKYRDYLINHIVFLKPIIGEMTRNENIINKNFHDEQEWRYIPLNEESDIKIIAGGNISQKNYYNDMLRDRFLSKKLWLEFEYEDLKYLLVPNKRAKDALISFIINNLDITLNQRIELASKIIVFKEIRGDI